MCSLRPGYDRNQYADSSWNHVKDKLPFERATPKVARFSLHPTSTPTRVTPTAPAEPYWTLPVILEFPFSVNVQVLALFPPLEQAPDQIASRPFVTLRVMAVPVANEAACVLPTGSWIPDGLDKIDWPLRPVAETVNCAVCGGAVEEGFSVNCADCVAPPPEIEMVTTVGVATDDVKMLNPPVVDPAGIVTELGVDATAGLLLATCRN